MFATPVTRSGVMLGSVLVAHVGASHGGRHAAFRVRQAFYPPVEARKKSTVIYDRRLVFDVDVETWLPMS